MLGLRPALASCRSAKSVQHFTLTSPGRSASPRRFAAPARLSGWLGINKLPRSRRDLVIQTVLLSATWVPDRQHWALSTTTGDLTADVVITQTYPGGEG